MQQKSSRKMICRSKTAAVVTAKNSVHFTVPVTIVKGIEKRII